MATSACRSRHSSPCPAAGAWIRAPTKTRAASMGDDRPVALPGHGRTMLSMPPRSKPPPLPCPSVTLDAGLRARAERFAARLAAARGRREGAARAGLAAGGLEFDHYRPYRPGDDLRALDWDVYARSDQAVVRVLRPEAGERWAILLDTSASMGVGPPGKLQRAAECALALAHLGLREEAEIELVDLVTRERVGIARGAQAGELARWLEGRVASGV